MTSMVTELGLNGVYKYLADRGVGTEDIEARGLTIGMAHDIGLTSDERMCVVFPHFDMQGEPIDWWSARLISTTPSTPRGFAALVPTKRIKMFCPAKEAPAAYLDPTLDWTAIEAESTIYIHESCLKAINGAKCGTYSVGLNGVWGWGSKKHDIALVSQLKDLPWKAKKLRCVVIFDSDAATNDDVALAVRRFAERMKLICGVDVLHHLLPRNPVDGSEWGFDDFCAHHGYEYAAAWLENGEETPVEMSEMDTLKLQLNAEVVVVRNIKRVVEQETGTMMGKAEFTDMNYAHYVAWVERGDAEVQVNVPKAWLTWERRRSVERMEYTPGGAALVDGEYLNLWRGMGVQPKAGSTALWSALLARSVPAQGLRRYLCQWLAYPLQNLGAKMNTYIHMYGPPGGGKNALLTPLLGIYGDNGIQLGRERIASDFNEVYATKQFINLDELHGGNDRDGLAIGNKIKMLTTAPKLTVNGKGKGEYTVNNHINLITTSNYADAIKLDEGDRRCLVLRVGERTNICRDPGVWVPYFAWANSVEGQAALYDYLLGYDLTGFDPNGWAPETADKELVTDATRSPLEKWVRLLREDPEQVLPPIFRGARVLTPEAVAHAYVSDDPMGRVTPALKNAMGQMLREYGFWWRLVKVEGQPKRLWALYGLENEWNSLDMAKEWGKFRGKV
jgi:putative DNA primase/helicase